MTVTSVSGFGSFTNCVNPISIKPSVYGGLHSHKNKLQPELVNIECEPQLSESQIDECKRLILKIKEFPVFCFSVSDLEFLLEKPLIINGKTENDFYFYTLDRLERLKKLIPAGQYEF